MRALTKREMEVLTALRTYIADHGYAPTLAELCAATNTASKGRMSRFLTSLQSCGAIIRTHREARQIHLVDNCPYCGWGADDEEIINITLKRLDDTAQLLSGKAANGERTIQMDALKAAELYASTASLIRGLIKNKRGQNAKHR